MPTLAPPARDTEYERLPTGEDGRYYTPNYVPDDILGTWSRLRNDCESPLHDIARDTITTVRDALSDITYKDASAWSMTDIAERDIEHPLLVFPYASDDGDVVAALRLLTIHKLRGYPTPTEFFRTAFVIRPDRSLTVIDTRVHTSEPMKKAEMRAAFIGTCSLCYEVPTPEHAAIKNFRLSHSIARTFEHVGAPGVHCELCGALYCGACYWRLFHGQPNKMPQTCATCRGFMTRPDCMETVWHPKTMATFRKSIMWRETAKAACANLDVTLATRAPTRRNLKRKRDE